MKLGASQSRENFAQFIVHELGHGLGANHDDSSCTCDAGSYSNCVMAASVNTYQINNYKWSDCSKAEIAYNLEQPNMVCLLDEPKLYMPSASSPCGNGIVETGEECDCGGGDMDNCAEFCDENCELIGDSTQCEPSSICCDSAGQFSASSAICRASRGSCDSDEYCSSSSALCPDDVYTTDGTDCTGPLTIHLGFYDNVF